MSLHILHEDHDIVAVDKPADTVVVPARNEPPERALKAILEAQLQRRLWVIHRLDRDTTGVCVLAKTAAAHRRWSMAFEAHAIHKTYVALTYGVPAPAGGMIDVALHGARKGRMRPARPNEPQALASRTDYRTLRTWSRAALVELTPHSGRQHQIRVHLRSIGTPLLVDPVYGGTHDLNPPCARLTLHASALRFDALALDAPLPADLVATLAWLDALAP